MHDRGHHDAGTTRAGMCAKAFMEATGYARDGLRVEYGRDRPETEFNAVRVADGGAVIAIRSLVERT